MPSATVSRMGMIFLSDEDADIKAIVSLWLQRESEETRSQTESLIDECFYRSLEWVLSKVIRNKLCEAPLK